MDIATSPTMARARRGSLLVAAAVLAVLVLSGCGSDSSGTAAGASNAGSLAQDSNLGNTGNGKAAAEVAQKAPGSEV